MKPMFKVSLLAATVLFAVGCNETANNQASTAPEASAPARVTATTPDEKAAYAMGVIFAGGLKTNLSASNEYDITINNDLVLQGINDAFNETTTLTNEQAEQELKAFNERIEKSILDKQKQESEENKKIGDEYRANFEKEEGVQKTESGILYRAITEGTGESPKTTDGVVVHYEGKLIDGTKFDSSYDRNQPVTFPLTNVIPGWTEILQVMNAGSKFEVAIPPELAYGEAPQSDLPGNSTLLFTIELLEIIPQEQLEARMQAQRDAQQKAYVEAQQAQIQAQIQAQLELEATQQAAEAPAE